MTRSNLDGARIERCLIHSANKFGIMKQNLGAAEIALDADMPHVLFLDPGGSGQDVLLPPEEKGLFFYIVNDDGGAGETLTVKEDSDSTTIGTVETGTIGFFVCDGTAWFDLTVPSELGILDDYTGTAAELNYLDIASLGTGAASKAVVLDGSSNWTSPGAGTITIASSAVLDVIDGFQINSVALTATMAEINQACDESANVETLTGATNIESTDSGKTYFLNATTGFECILPVPAVGLRYRFIVKLVPTSGSDTIVTDSGDNIFQGQLMGASTVVPVVAQDSISFDQDDSDIGDWFELYSDGTSWFINGAFTTTGGMSVAQT